MWLKTFHSTFNYSKQHKDQINGVHWISVMDDRTISQCHALDRKRCTNPGLHPINDDTTWPGFLFIKWNCRSVVPSLLKPIGKPASAFSITDESFRKWGSKRPAGPATQSNASICSRRSQEIQTYGTLLSLDFRGRAWGCGAARARIKILGRRV